MDLIKNTTPSYFHPFHKSRLVMVSDLMCQTGDCQLLPSMKVHQLFAMINTFGLNWNKISSYKFIRGSVYVIGGVVDGAEVVFVDDMNSCERLPQCRSAHDCTAYQSLMFE